ncbi:MAG: HpaII family restriction endonuclease [Firmicutes bacterium]|nr:HpaII family restriction endonuclease [Bacillota bacterium]
MAANRGEWAELYVIFKLLGDGRIYSADENLVANPRSYIDIIKIIREEVKDKLIEYRTGSIVDINIDGRTVASIPASDFLYNAEKLLQTITTSKGRSFDVLPVTKEFTKRLLIKSFKAPSRGYYENFGGKNDIIMEIRDHDRMQIVAGFSIKSKYKNAPTLFNAAKASAFTYELEGINDEQMAEINSIVTAKGGRDKNARLEYIKAKNLGFNFSHIKHRTFEDNMDNVRGDMQKILKAMLEIHYFKTKKNSKFTEVTEHLISENPLQKRNPEIFYTKAIKDLLWASFAGMTASEQWNGLSTVNGGYIVAKDNGEVLAYHTRDMESFRTFLFNQTKFDRPSASESKYDYAQVYKKGDKYFFDLNFQIRFID